MAHKTKLHLWVEENLKELIYKEAQKRDMSISAYVRYVLRKEVEK